MFSSMRRPARRLLACATVALAILQAIVLIGSATHASGADASEPSAREFCAARGDANSAPLPHHSGEHHCVLCSDKDAQPPAVEPAAAFSPPRRVAAARLGDGASSPRAPPPGWASSWSSRAPPSS
jgi:hypothetical protein